MDSATLATDDVPVLRRIVKAKLIGQRSTFNGHLEFKLHTPTISIFHPLWPDYMKPPTRLPAVSYSASYSRWPGLLQIHFFPGPTLPPQDPLHSSACSSGGMPMHAGHPSSSSAHAPQGSATGNNTSSTQEPRKEGSGTVDRFAVGRNCIGKTFRCPIHAVGLAG
jgi:hypothetical protein